MKLKFPPLLYGMFLFACLGTLRLHANPVVSLTLPHVFGDHMVMQEGQPVPIWGWDKPRQIITVSFSGQQKTTTSSEDGAWKVKLDPLAISALPADLTVSAACRDVPH